MTLGRLIPIAAGSGAWNMATDQALLESVDASQIPVLRFYQWTKPTVSLGYFQKLDDRQLHPASFDRQEVDCVRRSTGGGAIVHDHELTYSVAIPVQRTEMGARLELYHGIHAAIARCISELGVRAIAFGSDPQWAGDSDSFLCFQRRTDEDLIACGYKILGSAQRRTKSAVLQHGSLLLKASRFAPELPGLLDLGMRDIAINEFVELISRRISDVLGHQWKESALSMAETENAESIAKRKYADTSWTCRR